MKYILAINPEDEVEVVKHSYIEQGKPFLLKNEPLIIRPPMFKSVLDEALNEETITPNLWAYMYQCWGVKNTYGKEKE